MGCSRLIAVNYEINRVKHTSLFWLLQRIVSGCLAQIVFRSSEVCPANEIISALLQMQLWRGRGSVAGSVPRYPCASLLASDLLVATCYGCGVEQGCETALWPAPPLSCN